MLKDMQLTEHFKLSEFLHDGVEDVPDDILANLKRLAFYLEGVRAQLGNRVITINSGYRTPEHNKAVGGAKNSFHLKGMAADIVVSGLIPKEVQVILKGWQGGMGLGETFTHLDIRPYKARFTYK